MARGELLHHTPFARCAQAFSHSRPRFVISSSSPWWSAGAVGADRDLPVTGRADRSVRALPPSGIAFHVVLVAPPRPVRGPGRAEWVPSAGTSNGPLSAPRPRPTISAPARGGSGTAPSPVAPMLPPSAGRQRTGRRPAPDAPPLRRTQSPPHGPSAALPHPSPHRAREGR